MTTLYERLVEWSSWGWPQLANHLWQATLFALLALGASALLRRGPARARYAIWLLASLKFALPSALFFFVAERAGFDLNALLAPAFQSSPSAQAITPVISPVVITPVLTQTVEPVARAAQPAASVASLDGGLSAQGHGDLYLLLTGVWMLGCALLLASWWRRRRLLCAALEAGKLLTDGREWQALARVRKWMNVRREVRLISSPKITEPGVWGIRRPSVVLPEGVAESLSDAELEAVLMHELLHVERWDNLASSVQRILCCLLWFHPFVWLIDRRMLAEREQACDDGVIGLSGTPEVYASSIAKVCRFYLGWNVSGLSSVGGSNLKKRIERIAARNVSRRLTAMHGAWLCALATGLIGLSLVAGLTEAAPPFVADESPRTSTPDPRFIDAPPASEAGESRAELNSSGHLKETSQPPLESATTRPVKNLPPTVVEVKSPEALIEGVAPGSVAVPPQQEATLPLPPVPPQSPTTWPMPPVPQQSEDVAPPAQTEASAFFTRASFRQDDLSRYAGRYEIDPARVENFVIDITLEGGELWLKPSHSNKRRLVRTSETEFADASAQFQFTILEDERGRVAGLRLSSWGRNINARRIALPQPSLSGNTTFRIKGYANARVVAVAGTFNNWNQSQLLFAREGDEWVCRINLPPGVHEYKFIVDGNWMTDPQNSSKKHDRRGFLNSVLVAD